MLTAAQRERLQTIHAYEWTDDDPATATHNLDGLFNKIESHEELWYASFIIPWDSENGEFDRILNNQYCDRGIALFLYWSLDPIAYHRSPDASPNGPLIDYIEQQFNDGCYESEHIAFSPLESSNYDNDHYGVPASMLVPTNGLTVAYDYRNAAFPSHSNGG